MVYHNIYNLRLVTIKPQPCPARIYCGGVRLRAAKMGGEERSAAHGFYHYLNENGADTRHHPLGHFLTPDTCINVMGGPDVIEDW